MNLKTFVKVGNISNLSDARYCAGYGVNMLGFNLDPSQPDAISIETAKEIMGWVAVDHFVLECGNLPISQIKEVIQNLEAPFVQVDDIETAQKLASESIAVILRFQVGNQDSLDVLSQNILGADTAIQYLLIESETFDLFEGIEAVIKTSSSNIPILKAFDNEASSMHDKIQNTHFYGIALKGSAEEKPGFKDYDELADILEVLEIED